jgi:hypothetical protein
MNYYVILKENNKLDFEINLRFIENVRENIGKDENTKNVKLMPRDEDLSQYVFIDDENVLLSFSNG